MRSVCRTIRQFEVVELALQRTIPGFAFDLRPGKPLFDFVPELAAGACVRTKGLRRDRVGDLPPVFVHSAIRAESECNRQINEA